MMFVVMQHEFNRWGEVVNLYPVVGIEARNAEEALHIAKDAGHFCPIIGPVLTAEDVVMAEYLPQINRTSASRRATKPGKTLPPPRVQRLNS